MYNVENKKTHVVNKMRCTITLFSIIVMLRAPIFSDERSSQILFHLRMLCLFRQLMPLARNHSSTFEAYCGEILTYIDREKIYPLIQNSHIYAVLSYVVFHSFVFRLFLDTIYIVSRCSFERHT